MVTLAILAILVMVAAPSMQDFTKKSAVRSHLRELQSSLAFARGEAVSLATTVTMCPSTNGETCSGTGTWSNGWIVYVGGGGAGGIERLIRVYNHTGNNTLTVVDPLDGGSPLTSLSWNYRGFSRSQQRALATICASDGDAKYARGMQIAGSGRAIATQAGDDLIHEATFEIDGGTPQTGDLTCP